MTKHLEPLLLSNLFHVIENGKKGGNFEKVPPLGCLMFC